MRTFSISKQIGFLTLVTTLFVAPYLFLKGTNIVTHTYAFGSRQLWLGLSPYVDPKGAGDYFKYSPLFAWAYTPFALLSSPLQACLWGIFNMLCFWTGVSLWFPWKDLKSRWLWLAFVFCSMEADGSFRYQQMNAALVGITLTGLFLYKQKNYFWAGFLLALITNIKILPGLFLMGLLIPPKKNYLAGILAGLVFCLSVPLMVWGLSKTLAYHYDWYSLLRHDTQTDGLLDIATTLKRWGFADAKTRVLYPLSFFSLILFLTPRFKREYFSWGLWISLGLFTLLLINPRTESPTFVLAGPAYLFLLQDSLNQNGLRKALSVLFWITGIFLITLCMNDIWPKIIWNPSSWLQTNKPLGVFILWSLTICSSIKLSLK